MSSCKKYLNSGHLRRINTFLYMIKLVFHDNMVIDRLNPGIFRIIELSERKLNLNSSDFRVFKVI